MTTYYKDFCMESKGLKIEELRRKLKPCRTCGTKPVLESWSSGGAKFAVRCNNPDRPNSCSDAFHYSLSRSPEEAVKKWNEYQDGGANS